MPYSGPGDSSLPSNVKKMPKAKKKKWVSIWNSTYESCVADGGSTSSCETKAFKAANSAVSQAKESVMAEKNTLRRVWDRFLDFMLREMDSGTKEEVERAIGFGRLREQLWTELDNSERAADGWIYPIDIFIEDDGSLSSVVTQNGKLYQVKLSLSNDNLSLGEEWVQVTEVFEPVEQNRFAIKRQADGRHRWLFVAATSVINRVGEIDSGELFDSFVADAEETGKYPRVDFYHMGDADPEAWEFGTADYLARDNCCYIATGLFDEEHPLAKATIRAYEENPDVWGCSIEFYAKAEPELILASPEIKVPVYKSGRNTRISVVKEVDAAGLFTRIGITEEKSRMKRDVLDKLTELFGDDEEALAAFIETVDTVNRTVKDEKMVHRNKKAAKQDEATEDEEEDGEAEEETEGEEDTIRHLELDDEALSELAGKVATTPAFAAIQQSLEKLQTSLDELAKAKEENTAEIARLKKDNGKLAKKVQSLEQDEDEKFQEKLTDLPRRKTATASYRRPREIHAADEDEEDENDLAAVAAETLRKLPRY